MNVLITGAASGIGLAAAKKYLKEGYTVFGLDRLDGGVCDENYFHYKCDVSEEAELPVLPDMDILFLNAGTQNEDDIKNNLLGSINVCEKYAFGEKVKSVLFNASASAVTGAEFPQYAASKAGVVGYMKNVALRLAKKGVAVNALCLGGVITDLNKPVMEDKTLWQKIMDVTPLKKWITVDEVADWVFFLTVVNKSMTGEALLIDNGEAKLNQSFVWPEGKVDLVRE